MRRGCLGLVLAFIGFWVWAFTFQVPPKDVPYNPALLVCGATEEPIAQGLIIGGELFMAPCNSQWFSEPPNVRNPSWLGRGALPDFAPETRENRHLFSEKNVRTRTARYRVNGSAFGMYDHYFVPEYLAKYCEPLEGTLQICTDYVYWSEKENVFVDIENELAFRCTKPGAYPGRGCESEIPLLDSVSIEVTFDGTLHADVDKIQKAAARFVCNTWVPDPANMPRYNGCKNLAETGRFNVPPPLPGSFRQQWLDDWMKRNEPYAKKHPPINEGR